MICPKCGFNQPEDIYCAQCGVHVKKYHQKQKKKTLIILASVLILIGGAALFTGRVYRLKTLTRKVRAPLARIPQLQVGSHTKEDFPVAVRDMRPIRDSFEGILGMDFLQGFTITVDAEAKKISLSTAGSQKEEAP